MGIRGRTVLVVGIAVLVLSGCSGEEDPPERTTGVDTGWYDELDAAVEDAGEIGEIPTLSAGECPVDTPDIAGEEPEDDTPDVGVSTLGDSGHRLICSWSGPSADLVVAQFDDPAEVALARDEVGEPGEVDNGDNVQVTEAITVGERDIVVRRTEFPTNDSHVDYAAWWFDDDNDGLVLLDVETTDTRGLIESYDSQQAAEDLAALLDGS